MNFFKKNYSFIITILYLGILGLFQHLLHDANKRADRISNEYNAYVNHISLRLDTILRGITGRDSVRFAIMGLMQDKITRYEDILRKHKIPVEGEYIGANWGKPSQGWVVPAGGSLSFSIGVPVLADSIIPKGWHLSGAFMGGQVYTLDSVTTPKRQYSHRDLYDKLFKQADSTFKTLH